jgi:poly(3-hydroxyalkanoate) synthetase
LPKDLDFKISFYIDSIESLITLRVFTGKIKDKNSLIWEKYVQTLNKKAPNSKESILKWLEDSHSLIKDWFSKLFEKD